MRLDVNAIASKIRKHWLSAPPLTTNDAWKHICATRIERLKASAQPVSDFPSALSTTFNSVVQTGQITTEQIDTCNAVLSGNLRKQPLLDALVQAQVQLAVDLNQRKTRLTTDPKYHDPTLVTHLQLQLARVDKALSHPTAPKCIWGCAAIRHPWTPI